MTWIAKILDPGNPYNYPVVSGKKASLRIFEHKQHSYMVKNPNAFPLRAEDSVEVTLAPGKIILFSAIIFIMPLMFFPLGFFLAEKLIPAIAGEGMELLFGLGCLIAGFPLAGLIRGKRDMPVITRILSPAEAAICQNNSHSCDGSCKV